MRDRQPTKPGRVLLTPENGDAPFYAVMEMADEPTDLGTPPITANLLTDDTEAALFGSVADRTVNQAFAGIAGKLRLIMSDMATMTLTVKSTTGNTVPGVLVEGIFDDSGDSMYTDDSGVIYGYVTEGSVTLKISGYADIADYSETIEVTKGAAYTKELTVTTKNFLKLTSSKSVKFSGNVSTIDVTAVGGGGGGAGACSYSGYNYVSGPGGGGGYCTVQEGLEIVHQRQYSAIIGSGGQGSNNSYSPAGNAGDGGKTSFAGVEALGGTGAPGPETSATGGAGNGKGGNGRNSNGSGNTGTAGSVLGYSSFTETVRYGGGGGGGGAGGTSVDSDGDVVNGSGGADYGAPGGNASSAAAGTGGGGGGGHRYYSDGNYIPRVGGNGGSGCIAIRMHLKSA